MDKIVCTENGARATNTTQSALLDFYGTVGSMRSRSDNDIIVAFNSAFAEDRLLALKILFYARNCRGGLGERNTVRIILRHLGRLRPEYVVKNMALIPLFGRFDDLYCLVGTRAEPAMWQFMRDQFIKDLVSVSKNQPASLLAKWMKSVNASSRETKRLGRLTAKKLNMTEKAYRKTLSEMREYLSVVEHQMSANEWFEINYGKVPSYAMKNYRRAFARHDELGFADYLKRVEEGKDQIHSGTLFPYDLVREYLSTSQWADDIKPYDKTIELQWGSLPDYIGEGKNLLVMADLSGSMWCGDGRPFHTSVGLATYFAQHNTGPFKNLYMSFSHRPEFVRLEEGMSLHDCIECVMEGPSGVSTNLEAAFMLLLRHAINSRATEDQLPKAIVVVSDMEINNYTSQDEWDFLEAMDRKFTEAGYSMPSCIMWNVESRQNTFLTNAFSNKVQFVSGQSASVFQSIVNNIGLTAYESMIQTLSDPMYDLVTV